MNNLQIFESEEFGAVRTVTVENEPFFCLVDICKALEISNVSQAKTRLNQDGVISNEVIDSIGRTQTANFVNESNMYKLIFQSRKKSAERFTEWVTSEVLPAIRRTGGYQMQAPQGKELLALAVLEAQKTIDEQSKAIERMKPKVIFANAVETSHTSILIGDLAKLLKQNGVETGQKRLFDWMREKGYLIKRKGSDWNMPTQKAMNMKLFEVKESTVNNPDGSVRINRTTKVTGRGQTYFVNKFLDSGNHRNGNS